MTFIHQNPWQDVDEKSMALFARHLSHYGYLPNYTRLYKNRTAVMDAWSGLQKSIKSNMSELDYELITLASAVALKNSYCALAHGQVLLHKFFNESQLLCILNGNAQKVLAPGQIRMMSLATQIAKDATMVTQQDIDDLKSFGYDEESVFDLVATASARCFFSKVCDALGAGPDPVFRNGHKALLELLTVGRPITEITRHQDG